MKIAPPQKKKIEAQIVYFLSESSDSAVYGRALRGGNDEEFWEN